MLGTTSYKRIFSGLPGFVPLLLFSLCCIFSYGCAGKPVIKPPVVITPSTVISDPLPSLEKARTAYNMEKMQEAVDLALNFLSQPELDSDDVISAWQLIARASLAGGSPEQSINALEQWRNFSPQADYNGD